MENKIENETEEHDCCAGGCDCDCPVCASANEEYANYEEESGE